MKPGLNIGHTATVEITVSADMEASFEGETVHEIYSTSALVHHMEWAARRALLPYLEPHEEAMGCHVDVWHMKPTLIGMQVRIKAIVKEILNNKIICDVEVFNSLGKIARGYVTQAVVEKSWLNDKKKELLLIDNLSKQAEAVSHQRG